MTDNLFEVDLTEGTATVPNTPIVVKKEEAPKVTVQMQIDSPRWLWDDIGHLQFHLDVDLDNIGPVVGRFQEVWQELAVEFDVAIPEHGGDTAAGGPPATDKQVAFLQRLGVAVPAGITKAEASDLIEKNASGSAYGGGQPATPAPAGTGDGPPATPKQVEYIRSLLKRTGRTEPQGLDGYTKSAASSLISELLKAGR